MLSQLVYVSNRSKDCDDDQIKEILDTSIKKNPTLGITGILLYTDDRFIQLIEGDDHALKTLYDKIKQDWRHEDCVMLSFKETDEKSFPKWHMGSKNLKQDFIKYDTQISENERSFFRDLVNGTTDENIEITGTLKKFFDKLPDKVSVYRS